MAHPLAALAVEGPGAEHPFLELRGGDVVGARPLALPGPLVEDDDHLDRGDHVRGAGGAPAAPGGAARDVALVPDDGGVVLPAELQADAGDVGGQRLLAVLVLVDRDVDAQAAGVAGPEQAVAHPGAGEPLVAAEAHGIVAGGARVGHADVVGRAGDDQVDALLGDAPLLERVPEHQAVHGRGRGAARGGGHRADFMLPGASSRTCPLTYEDQGSSYFFFFISMN